MRLRFQQTTRRRLLPIVYGLVALCVLLGTSIVPKVQNGLTVFPSPTFGPGPPLSYVGIREFGWPAAFKADCFTAENPPFAAGNYCSSPLEHVFGKYNVRVFKSKLSITAAIMNLMFFAVSVVLATVMSQAMLKRRFTLRCLLGVVTCLGIIMGALAYAWSLPVPNPYFGWESLP